MGSCYPNLHQVDPELLFGALVKLGKGLSHQLHNQHIGLQII